MAINVSVQYNDGLLPDIILLTQGYYRTRGGTRLRLHYTRLFPDPRFLLFVLQNISGYKNAVECLLQ